MAGLFRVCGNVGCELAKQLYEWAVVVSNPPKATVPAVRHAFGLGSRPFPGIYLLEIGTVANLHQFMALADDVAGSKLVIKFGKTTDLWRRFGDHESHFGVLPGADVRIVSYLPTDKEEIDRAEDIVKNWFDIAAEPLNSTGPQTLRGGGKRGSYSSLVYPCAAYDRKWYSTSISFWKHIPETVADDLSAALIVPTCDPPAPPAVHLDDFAATRTRQLEYLLAKHLCETQDWRKKFHRCIDAETVAYKRPAPLLNKRTHTDAFGDSAELQQQTARRVRGNGLHGHDNENSDDDSIHTDVTVEDLDVQYEKEYALIRMQQEAELQMAIEINKVVNFDIATDVKNVLWLSDLCKGPTPKFVLRAAIANQSEEFAKLHPDDP
ncbi:hypothetical protein HDU86_001588 [Geranomyces michiganensis]|nr:hypothetical protein HDU86_001588 [Geranomyces michiganensis]